MITFFNQIEILNAFYKSKKNAFLNIILEEILIAD